MRPLGSIILAWAILVRGALALDFERYLWEAPRVRKIDFQAAQSLVDELHLQVALAVRGEPLAPLRLSYGDTREEAYWLYYEPGRMITTLAWAWPYLRRDLAQKSREYVHRILADPVHTPYRPGVLGPTDGRSRALHGQVVTEGPYVTQRGACPTLHVLYGLWLWADRTGDWQVIRQDWPRIKTRYLRGIEEEPILYGQMSAHIAVARLAKRFADRDMVRRATEAFVDDLTAGSDLRQIEKRLARTRFAHFLDPRNRAYFPGNCWMFLDASPEILRFLGDTQREEYLRRLDQLKARYPLWWLLQAPYFTRWTGDESVGVTPEIVGMIFPAERWVAQTPREDLAQYLRSAPVGIGDCYWIEALVQGIEAFGTLRWERVDQ